MTDKTYTFTSVAGGYLVKDASGHYRGLLAYDAPYWIAAPVQWDIEGRWAMPARRFNDPAAMWRDGDGKPPRCEFRKGKQAKESLAAWLVSDACDYPAHSDAVERWEAWKEEETQALAAMQALQKERDERHRMMHEGFASLWARADLSNVERVALHELAEGMNMLQADGTPWPMEADQ